MRPDGDQVPCSFFFVILWIFRDLAVPKLREGRNAEPRSWGWRVVRSGGKGRGQPEEHRQLEQRTKSNSRAAFVFEITLDQNEWATHHRFLGQTVRCNWNSTGLGDFWPAFEFWCCLLMILGKWLLSVSVSSSVLLAQALGSDRFCP